MLHSVRREINYRMDVVRVTKESHKAIITYLNKTLSFFLCLRILRSLGFPCHEAVASRVFRIEVATSNVRKNVEVPLHPVAWLFGIRPVAPFPRRVHNLQQSIDSLAFDVRTFADISPKRSSHPKSLEKERLFAFPLPETRRTSDNEHKTTDCGNKT
ncbi:hypothetical protein AVEN_260786-1 [Araneus ventricosus]|uniref:Uncharacterized protein n=1 Tax=Araneus ventricosus TaxID=182803 RepID=A0A4Y2EG79_ARAVE|nr:hypothetical protein AVEN_260786-1 [Araneus ventricosus]